MTTKKSTVYTMPKDVAYRQLKGQALFLLPNDRFLYTMNETGQFIWDRILKRSSVEAIVTAFAKHFSVDPDTAHRDVWAFVHDLEKKSIISR